MLATRPDSPGHLLWLVRTGRARTRSDLQRATGLSRSTVVQRLDLLLAAGLIHIAGAAASTGGRPAQRLGFNPGHGVLLAAEIGADQSQAAVLDVGGQILADDRAEIGISPDPQPLLACLAQSFDRLLSATGWKPDQVRGIAVGTASARGGQELASRLAASWDCPVRLERATDLIALGEHVARDGDGGTLLLLRIGATVDSGLIVAGAIHRGAGHDTGDLGHVRMPGLTTFHCECGAYGCLAAAVGSHALAGRLTALGVPTTRGHDLAQLVRSGHPTAARLARSAGSLLGEMVAPAIRLIDPDHLVITGGIAGQSLLGGLDEALQVAGLPPRAQISIGTATIHALAAGAHRLLVEQVYAPTAVDAHLLAGTAPAAGFAGMTA